MSHSCRRRQAFTMIEIMVSLVLGVVILGIAYQLLYGSSKMNRKVEDKTEAVQSANLALESIRRDVRQLVTRPFLMSNGAFTGVVGDAQHPIMISANGTEMAFHVPDPKSPRPDPTSKKFKLTTVYYGLFKKEVAEGGHSATVYHLVRSEGTNPNVGREAGTCATGGSSNLGSIYLKEGKDADGKPLAPVQFKLLGPKMNLGTGSPTELSGDNNYYLEVRLFGCDSQAREEQPRTDLFVLDEPSRLANVPAQRVNEFTLFQPDPTPLFVAHLPPAIAGLPVDLTGPNAPPPGVGGPGRPGSNPANPNDPNNPASPGGNPNDPNNPAGPGTPGSNPPGTPGTPNANPPAGPIGPVAWVPGGPGAPPGPGTPPAGPGTPGGPPTIGLPPDMDPKGPKSWATYQTLDENNRVTGSVSVTVLRDGTMTFVIKDSNGNVVNQMTQANTPQAAGQNVARDKLNEFLRNNGIDPNSVPNDPSIMPPPDYTNN